ncbi:MAG: radical SAM protein [Limisphaerales bacterium]
MACTAARLEPDWTATLDRLPETLEAGAVAELYPERSRERDRWIVARRPPRPTLDPYRPPAFLTEEERADSGEIVSVATIFLVNRECPWRCVMCDLWQNTLTETPAAGAITAQIGFALTQLAAAGPPARQLKLYNAGSFFDPRAIPPEDYEAIAAQVPAFERVVVECHPALVNQSAVRFRDLLGAGAEAGGGPAPKLEVAMGLETAHPGVLEKLNKRMTLDQFRQAAEFLARHGIALRVFVLVQPPFLPAAEALPWARRSIDFAFDCGATVVSLIPTRGGNGALEALAERGEFSPPKLATLESAVQYGIGLRRGRVFADLWDLEKFSDCPACFAARRTRLREINLRQTVLEPVRCDACCPAARADASPPATDEH